ncbi:MAG: SMC family ATPase [Caldiserica bacterium]|jgi:exonuclease SbcC|nr:SMC family ATPase [Caldisericota bacterium]
MILLKKLEVHNFKQLESISLWFPDKGSFLIEGANEAGKSSLFEAVYFGIFGRPLVGTNTDLVNYSESAKKATVELEISAENETLLIRREIPKQGNQTAFLIVRQDDGKEIDRITKVKTVNERIERSLKFDWQAFLNSCFVEQKKLGKLEEATAQERRNALSKLINLDFMLELEDKFKITLEDKNKLIGLKEREELAKVRKELQPVEEKFKSVERKLRLISLKKSLQSLRTNEEEISRWRAQLAQLESQKVDLKSQVEVFDRLQVMATELKLFLNTRENASNLKKQIERVEEELDGLIKKKESLPELENQTFRLKFLKRKWDQVQELEQMEREAQGKLNSLTQEIESFKKGEEERGRLTAEKEEVQKRKRELEKDLGKVQRSRQLALVFSIGFIVIPGSALILVSTGILPVYLLSLTALLVPGIYSLWRYLKTTRELKALQTQKEAFSEAEQKLAGKIEAYGAPIIISRPGYSLNALKEELEFWELRKGRIERYLSIWRKKLENAGEPLGARTRDEVVGAINRTIGKWEDLKKEVSRIEERSSYLKGLVQLLEKSALEEKKHVQNLLALDPNLKLEEDSLKVTLADLQKRVQEIGGKELRIKLSNLESKMGTLQGMISLKEKENQKLISDIDGICLSLGISRESVQEPEKFPELETLKELEETQIKEERDALFAERESLKRKEAELSERLGLRDFPLDYERCQKEREEWEHHLKVREKARVILNLTRETIYNRVKPQTEYHMSLIVPLLTSNRYQEVRLTEDYRIRVWDDRARAYREKEIFSGGTQDQFSLALRLAFAMATLPQERGSSPGFIFLDEPFSSSDIDRTRALVDLLTRGVIHEVFPQVFVISHSTVVNPEDFDYYVYLENGKIVKNTIEEIHEYQGRIILKDENEVGLFQ